MIKSGRGNQNWKNAAGYLVLVLSYVLISVLLSLYCLIRRRRRWTASDPKEGNAKTPKHLYIVLKTSDVIILRGEKKISPYLVNIAMFLYEHKVAHVSIYVAECLLDSVFFDDLACGLHRRGFLMRASAGGGRGDADIGGDGGDADIDSIGGDGGGADIDSVGCDGGDMADPRNAANLFNGGQHEFTVVKRGPPQAPRTLHLKFVNKSNSHNKLIDAAEGSNITSEGEVVTNALLHPVCNKTVEGLIKKVIDFDKKRLFEEKGKTFQRMCYVMFLLITEVKQISITQVKRVLPSLCKKVEWIVTHIIKRITCFVTQFGVLYSPVGTSESNLWEKKHTQNSRTKISNANPTMEEVDRDDFTSSEKEPEGDTKSTLVLMNEFLKNSPLKDQQSVDTIKQLIEKNIPLYVQPICKDIFEFSFKDTEVDVVLSLRIGLTDYLAYLVTSYQNGKSVSKENFVHFLKDYFSSFFFLYNIIHPFNKDGIQPWVLSNAEIYEFFDYSVASVRQALAYYGSSQQRHGC
ncbi:hypothetical protein PCYB_052150 [Plasmodium cynomolgi strain B]|uniref:Uncharacterized protein n=1 Tax=Plasmodium cynomolgi (strain B) TaxID=1120755 RepID=K6V7U4_PLACD|nr:hypothetical protein PCYB_052150 [Plasmodium cynomolgi strain B]GAB65197.1 hypothetical protein PCYB_052150 [Plasmodium cynomolgi strain B]